MTLELELPSPLVLDPADNLYMPHHDRLQQLPLNPDPADLALLHTPPSLPSNIGTDIMTTGPVQIDVDELDLDLDNSDDIDDNSSDSLEPIDDDNFPSFFSQRGSPSRLFHSHGTYSLPVDGDEMKVCTSSFGAGW
jgi:hypothetical protein